MPCRWQICIAKFLFFYKDDLPREFQPSYCLTMQKVHFRLTSVAHKRCCLSSLFTITSLSMAGFRLPSKWENRAWYQVSSLSNFSGSLLGFFAFIVFLFVMGLRFPSFRRSRNFLLLLSGSSQIFNSYSSSSNGLWVNSPWDRRPNGSLTRRLRGREE